jgi:hypothetical protein
MHQDGPSDGMRGRMPKLLEYAKVDPSSGCQHVVRGADASG